MPTEEFETRLVRDVVIPADLLEALMGALIIGNEGCDLDTIIEISLRATILQIIRNLGQAQGVIDHDTLEHLKRECLGEGFSGYGVRETNARNALDVIVDEAQVRNVSVPQLLLSLTSEALQYGTTVFMVGNLANRLDGVEIIIDQ